MPLTSVVVIRPSPTAQRREKQIFLLTKQRSVRSRGGDAIPAKQLSREARVPSLVSVAKQKLVSHHWLAAKCSFARRYSSLQCGALRCSLHIRHFAQ